MACLIIIGTQWGDEGKGKVVDLLTERADAVVRFQGGNNAGHTVMFGKKTFVLHMLPSGILRETISILGNGVVIDLSELVKEINELEKMGIDVAKHLLISDRAHLVMPWHKTIDQLREQKKGKSKIGTTGRGIGPTYEDKAGRAGFRVGDLLEEQKFSSHLSEMSIEKNNFLTKNFDTHENFIFAEDIFLEYTDYIKKIKPCIADTPLIINQMIKNGKNILFEGAQGTFLDVDHGTYPFVTSSNTLSANACVGSGIGPTCITGVLGIVKAYTTRVGNGPFPTELLDGDGKILQTEGNEFGATTGRSRRCGWFDALLVRQAVELNGITSIALTKLDVLDNFQTLKIAISYILPNGKESNYLPRSLENVTPVYYEMPGWKCRTAGLVKYDQLPDKMLNYIDKISELVGAKVSIISTGPKREETIVLNPDQFWV